MTDTTTQDRELLKKECDAWRKAAQALYFAYTPYGHFAPSECFATGPLTGNDHLDFVVCPGCEAEHAFGLATNGAPND